jgi:hypothetical protein
MRHDDSEPTNQVPNDSDIDDAAASYLATGTYRGLWEPRLKDPGGPGTYGSGHVLRVTGVRSLRQWQGLFCHLPLPCRGTSIYLFCHLPLPCRGTSIHLRIGAAGLPGFKPIGNLKRKRVQHTTHTTTHTVATQTTTC